MNKGLWIFTILTTLSILMTVLVIMPFAEAELNEDTGYLYGDREGFYGISLPIQLEEWQAIQLVALNDFIDSIDIYEGYAEIYFDVDRLGGFTVEQINYELSLLVRQHNNAQAESQWSIWYPKQTLWMYTPDGDALPCELYPFQGGAYYMPVCFPTEGARASSSYMPPPNLGDQ